MVVPANYYSSRSYNKLISVGSERVLHVDWHNGQSFLDQVLGSRWPIGRAIKLYRNYRINNEFSKVCLVDAQREHYSADPVARGFPSV